MTLVHGFISELIRAANEVGKLQAVEKKRLLERVVNTIRDMREQIGVEPDRDAADVVIDLQTVAGSIPLGRADDDRVKAALLEGASAIRTLKMLLDAKGEALRGE